MKNSYKNNPKTNSLDYFLTVKQMQTIDKKAVKYGIPIELMMENVGKAIAMYVFQKFSRLGEKNIVCISGVGNNGGGVISAARHITCFGGKPTLILLKSKKFISNSSKFHLFITRRNKRIQTTCVNKNNFKKISLLIKNSDIIIDGIFGTGFQNEIHDPIYTIITQMNKSKAHIISNDVPSGINADTGISANISVNSDFIIALHKPKKGILNSKIKFKIVDIGIPPEIDSPSKGVIA